MSKKNKEEKFICPACGTIVTQKDIDDDLENGGNGMCMCEFSTKDPKTGEVWFSRIYNTYHKLKPKKEKAD